MAMPLLSAPAQALLGSDAVAHVWTRNSDGSPQVSVVWVIVEGDEVGCGCDRSSQKALNLQRHASVVMSIEDDIQTDLGFQRHLVVRGTAELTFGPDPELMDRLAVKYAGLSRHPLAIRDSNDAVVVRVTVERISGVGPWVESTVTAS